MTAVINIKNEVLRGAIKIVVQTFSLVIFSFSSFFRGCTIGLFFELALLEDWVTKFPVSLFGFY